MSSDEVSTELEIPIPRAPGYYRIWREEVLLATDGKQYSGEGKIRFFRGTPIEPEWEHPKSLGVEEDILMYDTKKDTFTRLERFHVYPRWLSGPDQVMIYDGLGNCLLYNYNQKRLSLLPFSTADIPAGYQLSEDVVVDSERYRFAFEDEQSEEFKVIWYTKEDGLKTFEYTRKKPVFFDLEWNGYVIDIHWNLLVSDGNWSRQDLGKVEKINGRDMSLYKYKVYEWDGQTLRAGTKINTKLPFIKFSLEGWHCIEMYENKWMRRWLYDWEWAAPEITYTTVDIANHEEPKWSLLSHEKVNELRSFGITQLQYGSWVEFWDTILAYRKWLLEWNRKMFQGKPVLVIYYPKDDRNGTLMMKLFDENVLNNFHVIYFECGSEEDIKQANVLIKTSKIKPRYIWLVGHSTSKAIEFSEAQPLSCEAILRAFEPIEKRLKESNFIVAGCSTGEQLVECLAKDIPCESISGPDSDTRVYFSSYIDKDWNPVLLVTSTDWKMVTIKWWK